MRHICGIVAVGLASVAGATEVNINPRATYLRTNQDAGALNAKPVSLASVGLAPGDWARIERAGFFAYGNGTPDEGTMLGGVFSSSDVLLGADQLHRVAGAIAAGKPWVTGETFFGKLPTDIPEDFWIDDTTTSVAVVKVPAGATHMFFSVPDSYYSDNNDPNADFRIVVGVADCYADFNEDGALDLFDFLAFVNDFNAGGSRSDCDGNRTWDLFDFLCYVNAFNAGC